MQTQHNSKGVHNPWIHGIHPKNPSLSYPHYLILDSNGDFPLEEENENENTTSGSGGGFTLMKKVIDKYELKPKPYKHLFKNIATKNSDGSYML